MRVRIDPPSGGPVGLISILDGDDHGLGSVCYVGPWAYVTEDESIGAERWFRPDMQAVIKHHLSSKHFRKAVFCDDATFRRKEKWAVFWYDITPQRRISLFISGLSPRMKIALEFCYMLALMVIFGVIGLLIQRYVS